MCGGGQGSKLALCEKNGNFLSVIHLAYIACTRLHRMVQRYLAVIFPAMVRVSSLGPTVNRAQLSDRVCYVHGIYIRWYLINRCARKEQSLLFDLYKAFD